MNLLSCIKLALLNIRKRLKSSFLVFSGFLMICVLFMLVTGYYLVLRDETDNKLKYTLSDNYFKFNGYFEDSEEFADKIFSVDGISEIVIGGSLDIYGFLNGTSQTYLNPFIDAKIIIGESEFSAKDSDGLFFIEFKSLNTCQFPKNYYKDYEAFYGKDSFLYGSEIQNSNEIIISSDILTSYGIKNLKEIKGQYLSVTLTDNENNQIQIIKNYKIAGIINDEKNILNCRSIMYIPLEDEIWKHGKIYKEVQLIEEAENHFSISAGYNPTCYAYIQDYNFTKQAKEKIRKILESDYPDLSFTYANEAQLENFEMFSNQKTLVQKIFTVYGSIFAFAILIGIISSVIFNVRQKGAYFGILKAAGLADRKIAVILFLEVFLIFIPAVIFAFGAALGVIELLKYCLEYLIQITLNMKFWIILKALLYTFILGIVLSFIIMLANYIWISRKTTLKLLNR